MRTAFVRRTVLSASAVSLALLATACGGSGTAGAKGAAAASSAAPAAGGKTDAELAGLLLVQGDLAGYTFTEYTAAEAGIGERTSNKAECKVLVQVLTSVPPGTPTGAARTSVLDAKRTAATAVTLGSYEGKGAEEAFNAVKTASRKCAGGYLATQGGDSLQITKVTSGAHVTAGDEALALTFDADGHKLPTVVFVRKGNTVAAFSTASDADSSEMVKAVIDAQVEKLG